MSLLKSSSPSAPIRDPWFPRQWLRGMTVTTLFFLFAWTLFAEETPQSLLGATTSQEDLSLVDPELSQTPLPKLVLPPPEPPARVHLPELVVKSDEWRGVQCGVSEPRVAV